MSRWIIERHFSMRCLTAARHLLSINDGQKSEEPQQQGHGSVDWRLTKNGRTTQCSTQTAEKRQLSWSTHHWSSLSRKWFSNPWHQKIKTVLRSKRPKNPLHRTWKKDKKTLFCKKHSPQQTPGAWTPDIICLSCFVWFYGCIFHYYFYRHAHVIYIKNMYKSFKRIKQNKKKWSELISVVII